MRTSLGSALVTLACIGCGGSSSSPAGPSGLPVLVFQVHDGDVHVPPLVVLEVALPAGVSPASVAPAGVSLTGDVATGDAPTPVRVVVDASARMVRVQPEDGWLVTGRRYLLRLEGLTDAGGTPVAPLLVTFTVLSNPVVREFYYSGYAPPPELPGVTGWLVEHDLDADGFTTGTSYFSQGLDGILGTADDPLVEWQSMDGTPATGHVTTTLYTDPGTDGNWRTDDDVVGGRIETSYDVHGQERLWVQRLAGADGLIDTADDVVTCRAYVVELDGSLTVGACDAGADGEYGTSDDGFGPMQRWHYGPDGRLARTDLWFPGPDGMWGTADDELALVTVQDVNGGTETFTRWDVGPDGVWGTLDDEVLSLTIDQTTSLGNTVSTYYPGPGRDGAWGTVDDAVGYRIVTTTSGLTSTSLVFGSAGNDGTWGTGDDVPIIRSWVTMIEGGAWTVHEDWYGGPDGQLDTQDDYPTLRLEFLTDR